ncbi:cyclophilin-like fold protein [Marseilla massiliensis]|uniref:Cyclophilin-like domain-containing protein n=1 Tax=Marseilla massiliensis TaxID=1841864 RepID=A0A938WJX7_9BACT|nr:cyclophilin-like fold protein [Marseilla massiliensis]MBM6660377.1 hypothetical protein [Marseilla massiliensis]
MKIKPQLLSLMATGLVASSNSMAQSNDNQPGYAMAITANGHTMTATMHGNGATEALRQRLDDGGLTLRLSDYGDFEKVGALGFTLPRSDRQTTTQPGDIVLYQGNQIVIFYGSNTWGYTRLGHIDNATAEGLRQTLGEGDVTVTLALPEASSVADARQASPPLYTEVYTANGRMVLRQQGEAGLDRLERGHYIVRKAFANRQAETKNITK